MNSLKFFCYFVIALTVFASQVSCKNIGEKVIEVDNGKSDVEEKVQTYAENEEVSFSPLNITGTQTARPLPPGGNGLLSTILGPLVRAPANIATRVQGYLQGINNNRRPTTVAAASAPASAPAALPASAPAPVQPPAAVNPPEVKN